ncbi:TPA: hypothetical protein DF272_00125 [Candidatus Falkowbacteria bacterium]|nr:hypothetical protein [Candidatus Falkowbacteria bacterium]
MTKNQAINKKDLDEITQSLIDEKSHLEKELEKIAVKNLDSNDDYNAKFVDVGNDESDSVSEVAQFSLDKSLEETLEKALRDVNKSLENIKSNKYGFCKYCKQAIDVARLKARPTSSSCVTCKTKLKSL